MIPLVLKLLVRLPINWQCLKDNGKIGKTVKKLSGHSDKKIKKQARSLLKLWMKLVNRAQSKKTNGKRKELENREEPPPKRPRISSAFRTKESSGVVSPSELKIVKRTPVVKKEIPSSNKVIRKTNKSNDDAKTEKPNYKPLPRLSSTVTPKEEDANSSPTPSPSVALRNSLESVQKTSENFRGSSNEDIKMIVSTTACAVPPKDKQPLVSCLPNRTNGKKSRSVSWAPNEELVYVKYFPRDKSLSIDNPNMRMIKARMAAQFTPQPTPQLVQEVQIPQMKPSIRWRSPPVINFPPSICIAMGENSTECNTQRERERSTLKARYPDLRHIPQTPTADPLENQNLMRDEDIPVIPMYDMMKKPPTQGSPPQHQNRNINYVQPPSYSNDPYNVPYNPATPYPPQKPDLFRALQNNPQDLDILRQFLTTGNPSNSYNPQPTYQPPFPNYNPPPQNNFNPYQLPSRSNYNNNNYSRY